MQTLTENGDGAGALQSRHIIVICNDAGYFLRHRRAVVDALARQGCDVVVYTGGVRIPRALTNGWTYVNLRIERFSASLWADGVLFFRTFWHMVRRRPDAIHLITLKPAVVCGLAVMAARRAVGHPRRILVTIPGLGRLMSPASASGGWAARMARSTSERILRRISRQEGVRYTFETAHDRDHWISRGLATAGQCVVISGAGVDGQRFHPASEAMRRDRMRVLFASRLLKSKGLDAFLTVAKKLAERPDVEFAVAGIEEPNDPDSYSAVTLAAQASVTFLGDVAAMPELLRSVDLVCLPSRYGEGIPRILIEAAASGVACIATDLEGCAEIIEHDVTGTIIPVLPVALIADRLEQAILRYLDDRSLLESHGKAGLRKFRAGRFSEDQVVGEFMTLLCA